MDESPETLRAAFADAEEAILPPGSMTPEPASAVAASHADAWEDDRRRIAELVWLLRHEPPDDLGGIFRKRWLERRDKALSPNGALEASADTSPGGNENDPLP